MHSGSVRRGQPKAHWHAVTECCVRILDDVGDMDGVVVGVEVAERLLVDVGEGLAVAVAEEDRTGNMGASLVWIMDGIVCGGGKAR